MDRTTGDFLPAMVAESAALKELADSCDRPGQATLIRQYAEGYEAACYAIQDLRKEVSQLRRKVRQ